MMKKALFVLVLMIQVGLVAKSTKDNPIPDCFPCNPPAAVR